MHNYSLSEVRSKISAELQIVLKTGNRQQIGAFRAALHVLDNTTAVPRTSAHQPVFGASSDVSRKAVRRQDIEQALIDEAQERVAASIEYSQIGKFERAAELKEEADLVRGCLAYLDEISQ